MDLQLLYLYNFCTHIKESLKIWSNPTFNGKKKVSIQHFDCCICSHENGKRGRNAPALYTYSKQYWFKHMITGPGTIQLTVGIIWISLAQAHSRWLLTPLTTVGIHFHWGKDPLFSIGLRTRIIPWTSFTENKLVRHFLSTLISSLGTFLWLLWILRQYKYF